MKKITFLILLSVKCFGYMPSETELYNFSSEGMKAAYNIIDNIEKPYCKECKEAYYQWGRASAFRDLMNFLDTGEMVFYYGNPSRRD